MSERSAERSQQVSDEPGSRFTYVSLPCRIRVGKNAKQPQKWMIRLANRKTPGWFGVDVGRVTCRSCNCEWDDDPLKDPKDICCSNCYSDNVILTAIRITFEHASGPAQERA